MVNGVEKVRITEKEDTAIRRSPLDLHLQAYNINIVCIGNNG
jgi:hypothetical protein